MKYLTSARLVPFAAGGFLLLIDQWLKYLASGHPQVRYFLIEPWLGWTYFQNTGVAFSLPVSQFVVIPATLIIIGVLVLYTINHRPAPATYFGLVLIVFGAVSNFIDRILFGFTVDYLRIITSVINLADIMIVVGAVLFLWGKREKKKLMTHN